MKKPFVWVLVAVFALLIVFLLRTQTSDDGASGVTGNAVANTFALETLRAEVNRGDTVLVNVVAQDVSDVFGVQFSVRYDPAVLEFVSADEGSFLGRSGADETMYLASVLSRAEQGLVKDFVLVKLGDEGTSGSGVVSTLTFRSIGEGSTSLEFVDVIVADKAARPLSVETIGTTITVK